MTVRQSLRISVVDLSVFLLFIYISSLILDFFGVSIIRTITGFILLTFVPGSLLLTLLHPSPFDNIQKFMYAIGVSFLWIMGIGGLINFIYPFFLGINHPLYPIPLIVTHTILITILIIIVRKKVDKQNIPYVEFQIFKISPLNLFFLLLPLLSIISVSYLNITGNNIPLLLFLGIIALILLLITFNLLPENNTLYGIALWCITLSLIYHNSLWVYTIFTGQPNVIDAWRFGRWSPIANDTDAGITPLLSNGILIPTYAVIEGVSMYTQLHVINPIIFSFIPLAMFATFRQYTDTKSAFLGTAFLIVSSSFYAYALKAGRVGLPVFYLALIGSIIADHNLSPAMRRVLMLLFSSGIIVSHYGSTYFVMFALLSAFLITCIIKLLFNQSRAPKDSEIKLFWEFVACYIVLALTWYSYTVSGELFIPLARHIQNILNFGFLEGAGVVRLTKDYGTLSIRVLKCIYIIIFFFIVIGIINTYYEKLFQSSNSRFDYSYLALVTGVIGAFGLVFFKSGAWNFKRPYMLMMSIASIFVVIGAEKIFRGNGKKVCGLVLVTFLLFDSGFVAAIAGGYAPNLVPLHDRCKTIPDPYFRSVMYEETDNQALAWLAIYRYGEYRIWGDHIMHGVILDTGPPQLALKGINMIPKELVATMYEVSKYKELGIDEEYIFLGGHNIDMKIIAISPKDYDSIKFLEFELIRRNLIYTNGKAAIYFKGSDV